MKQLALMLERLLKEPQALRSDVAKSLQNANQKFADNQREIKKCQLNTRNSDAIFIWIPKSAGTSIYTTLENFGALKLHSRDRLAAVKSSFRGGIVTFGHLSVPQVAIGNFLPPEFFESSRKFTIVRDPYDRFVSLFEYFRKKRIIPDSTTFEIFSRFAAERAFEPVGMLNRDGLSQLNPQTSWLTAEDGRFLADDVFRFETIDEWWNDLFAELVPNEVPPVLPRLNTTTRKTTSEYYNEQTREIVRELYREDFETLGYAS